MTEEKALEAARLFASQGYNVRHTRIPSKPGWVVPGVPEDGVQHRVELVDLGFDKIDLRHVLEQADKLGLDASIHQIVGGGTISLSAPDNTPEVVKSPRQHPR
jgi:hypothetical protein